MRSSDEVRAALMIFARARRRDEMFNARQAKRLLRSEQVQANSRDFTYWEGVLKRSVATAREWNGFYVRLLKDHRRAQQS